MRAPVAGVVLCVAAVAIVAGGADRDLAPEIVRAPEPWTPPEAVGTGLAPSVDVRVTVGVDGRVAAVEVVSIEPSSPLDAAFEREVVGALTRWRFAPALRDGSPSEVTLDWRLQFRATPEPDRAGGMAIPQLDQLLVAGAPPEARLLRRYTLPLDRQRLFLDSLTERALAELDPGRRRTVASPLFRLVTDHPNPEADTIVLANLNAAFHATALLLEPTIPLDRRELPFRVALFAGREPYRRFVEAVDGVVETSGLFVPPGLIAFHTDQPGADTLLGLMIHEAAHAFLYGFVVRPGHALPRWLEEGFASYLGNSRVRDGRLEPGARLRTQLYATPTRVFRGRSTTQLTVDAIRRRVRKGTGLAVADVLAATADVFYGEDISLYYGQSWILVHFLRHGEPTWASDHFPRFMLYAAEGYPAADVIREVYGLEGEALEARYREYVAGF